MPRGTAGSDTRVNAWKCLLLPLGPLGQELLPVTVCKQAVDNGQA